MAGTASIQNGKKGGRPRGRKNDKTLEREAVLKAFQARAMKAADVLFDAQLTIARGQTFLYKIEKEYVKTGKSGFYKKKKPRLVTSQWEIEAYLEGRLREAENEDDDQDPSATYYFITTKEPSNFAIDSLLDRTLGKVKQSIDHTSEGKAMPQPLLYVLDNNGNAKDRGAQQEA